ncbi:MAG: glycoside hydrolase family 2 [Planctomycetes bacterium]|nr:glycoside hydrolase family 2 [Planctomycetota bacterium]
MTRPAHLLVAAAIGLLDPAGGGPRALGDPGAEEGRPEGTRVVSLDGDDWLLLPDPRNTGNAEEWFRAPREGAKQTRVPWIIQDAFPGYHGVAWYWKRFEALGDPRPHGRSLLRFWAIDYKCDVWLNGARLGEHEGGEAPFTLDATAALKLGEPNLLAVRVLNPTHEPIDGIVLNETPHRNKALPYTPGSAWDQGGIIDSVELLLAPAVRIADLFAAPDWKTGEVRVRIALENAAGAGAACRVALSAAPAAGGETVASLGLERELKAGEHALEERLRIPSHRLWDLNDPFLYRVTARVSCDAPGSADELSVRCGFRDFRFRDGAFRLNGRRIFLRSSHTGNCCPIGLELPHDPDLLRRDLLNAKVMGFNAIRFIAGVPKRYQLDLCDEIGLMVYEECYAGWCLADSPHMPRRFSDAVLGMVLRDQNHPSVTIWGLLNETPDGPVFRQAVGILPALRALDDTRLVLLNSGRWDAGGGSVAGIEAWRRPDRTDPCVTRNGTARVVRALGITWAPGQLAFHPGRGGEYAAVRWTAPEDGSVQVEVDFKSIAERATTDVHVLRGSKVLFDGRINVGGAGPEARFKGPVAVKKGDAIDCAVGFGNGDYGADTTALAFVVRDAAGRVHDAATELSTERNPSGPWSYGELAPGPAPRPETFARFGSGVTERGVGTLSNPGSSQWEDALSDQHPYQRVPHTAAIVSTLRTLGAGGLPLFISEYGIGSAVDLARAVRHYERLGKADLEDARLYRSWLDAFLADWERWRMAEAFDRPEDFFAQSNARMAGQRLLGLNAIRSNPSVVGYSLTGTVDQGMTGEGLWTTFREMKPGTFDAVFDGFAPLRWCLFAEPANVYRKSAVRLEAVLADEDALRPGEYPVRLLVVGPGPTRLLDRRIAVRVAEGERPFATPVFSEELAIDGPPGAYRFLASFEEGAAAAGGEAVFHVADAVEMPPVEAEVVLWGEDPGLAAWLAERGVRARPFAPGPGPPAARQVILASGPPPAPGGAAAFRELARRIARGSTAVFLTPSTLRRRDDAAGWVPLARKGALQGLPSWLYHKDEWAKRHPIFDGLPAGGLLDYAFYRELIPDAAWTGQEPPAETVAGACNASVGYSSGLLVAVHRLGAGSFTLNALLVRENLDKHPAAERLLRNMLRHASRDAAKPLVELPAGFEEALDAMGYVEQ